MKQVEERKRGKRKEERGKRTEERGKRKEERGKRKEERGKRKEERGKRRAGGVSQLRRSRLRLGMVKITLRGGKLTLGGFNDQAATDSANSSQGTPK